MSLKITLFGSPQIEKDGKTVSVDTRKAVALLAYLILTGQVHTRDSLAAVLWPESDQRSARAALRRTLSALRKAVGENALQVTRDSIGMEFDAPLWVDVLEFETRIAQSNKGLKIGEDSCSESLPQLVRAVELYRGDFLEGFTLRDSPAFDDWQFFESDRLRRAYAQTLANLVSCHREWAEYELALGFARRWLALDALHEAAHRALMELYAISGQRTAALKQYRDCVRVLEGELGVPPLEETTRLYEDILENRLTGPVNLAKTTGERLGEPPREPETDASGESTRIADHLPLVGRRFEWGSLLEAYQSSSGDGRFLVITGEAGVGKTRLAEEFIRYASQHGGMVWKARCYQGESGLAYRPFIELLSAVVNAAPAEKIGAVPKHWLVEAARLLPELTEHLPEALPHQPWDGPGAQTRLYEALRTILTLLCQRGRPAALLIDDLQWADAASVDLLRYLVRRLSGFPVLFIAVWRVEELSGTSPLIEMLAEGQRLDIGSTIQLERLSRQEVDELARMAEIPPALEGRLYEETEGVPFVVLEFINAIRSGQEGWDLPASIQSLQRSRLADLDEASRQLLGTAAVIGRSFDFETLRDASGRSEEETVTALEKLIARGLLVETARERLLADDSTRPAQQSILQYDFSHESLYKVVYDELTLARRRLLHRRIAQTLEAGGRMGRGTAGPSGQVARHYQLAGEEQLAAEYFLTAGDYAQGLYANAEAQAHFESALALGHPAAAQLHENIGDLKTLQGEYTAAAASYETAAALAEQGDLPRLEHKLGNLHHRRGDYDLAAVHFQAGFELQRGLDVDPILGQIYSDWSRTAIQQGHRERAWELARKGLALAEDLGVGRGQAQNILGILARGDGQFERARDYFVEALSTAKQSAAPRVAALNNLGLVHEDMGHFDEAIRLIEEALTLCQTLGDRHREAALLNHLADLHHAQGDQEAAMGYLKRAVEIFVEIEVEAGELEPEIWKLTEW